MFDFEKLDVYQEIRSLNAKVLHLLFTRKDFDIYVTEQFKRASLSSLLNLAEGTGRMTNTDKKRYYITARASVFECVAILQTLLDLGSLESDFYEELYKSYDKISRMLLGMIRSLDSTP
ncbi:MAG: four helix bundle protein [Saprospiraceae bacterium]|nr:four helix bundle protein [Saprospiraceae bacterium]